MIILDIHQDGKVQVRIKFQNVVGIFVTVVSFAIQEIYTEDDQYINSPE